MSALEGLISELRAVCAGLPDRRQGPPKDGAYTMADIGLSAFSIFFMGSPSFLAHQRALAEGHGRSNCETLFGISAIPTDNYIRLMLDGASPAAFDGLFIKAVETVAAADALAPFQCLDGRVLNALDGTEHFSSRKISCSQCSTRRRSDGGVEHFHSFLGASLVVPGHKQVLALPPEFIAPQDGAEKQDCERSAAKRWLAKHGPALVRYRPIYLGDDLFACQPIATAIQNGGGNFILTCKPSSHKTIAEYLTGAELQEHRQTVIQSGKRSTHIYRGLAGVPLRDSEDALSVNWFSVEICDAKGKRTCVTRTHHRTKEVRCCTRDEGRSLEAGSQVQASNHCKLRASRATVVNVAAKGGTRSRQVRSGEASESKPLMTCRNSLDDVKTGGAIFFRDKLRGGPEDCLSGIRHVSGANPEQALVGNVRTCRPDAKGDVQAAKPARTRVPMRGTGAEQSVVGLKVL